MPFNVDANPRGVEVLQPQKLYAYLASGLPVVASDWKNLRALDAPVHVCASEAAFIEALRQTTATPGDRDLYRSFASRHDWNNQVASLLEHLAAMKLPGVAAAA